MTKPATHAKLSLLKDPNVAKMFFAYLVSYTGTAMAPIAMAFGVLELTGSTRDAAIVIAAPTLAAIGVLLIGGVIADRTSRQRVIVCAEVLAMVAQLCLAGLFLSGAATIPLLTLFMLINGIAIAFHAPAATGFIIQLVDKKDLQTANALLGTARNGAMTGGAALGGVLVATFGAGITLLIDAISFGISALLVLSLTVRVQIPPVAATMLEDLRLGWREFISHTWLWTIVLQFSLIVAAVESVFGLIGPAVAKDLLGGPLAWGFIASGLGVGTLLGGLAGMHIRPKHPMRVASIFALFFASIELSLAVPLAVPWIVSAAFIAGFCGQLFSVLWNTTLQTKIPAQMLSRVSAYDHLGSIGLAPLGIIAAGILYELMGYRSTLLIAAGLIIIPTLLVLCVRDVRMMTSD